MGRPRVSILGMIAVVVILAMAFAALRTASDRWFGAVYTFTTVVLLVAVIAARYGHRTTRPFWFGFAVFGWGFFFLEMNPWSSLFVGDNFAEVIEADELGGLNRHLLSSNLVYFLVPYLRKGTDHLESINKITGNTIGIAHLLSTLTLALVGGFVGALVGRRGARARAGSGRSGNVAASLVILGGSAVGLVASAGDFARPSTRYFPPSALGEETGIFPFVEKWYSKHLAAMAEPALWRDREATTYRLLWLPTFHHPACVRIEEAGEGAVLHAKVLDGLGGYDPGQVAIDKRLVLDAARRREFERHLAAVSFWGLPTKMEGNGDTDGDQLIIEAFRGGKYHVVHSDSPDGAYADLCRSMLDLTGLDVSKTWDCYH